MQARTRKVLSVLLTLAVGLGVFAAMVVPAGAADISVVIAQEDSVDEISDKIGLANNAAKSGDTVIVTGSKTNANAELFISIPGGVRLIWKATLLGTTTAALLQLGSGVGGMDGMFELAAGGAVASAGGAINANHINITISGGTIKSTGNARTIASSSGDITVTGGTVSSTGAFGFALHSTDGDITLAGGKVAASGGMIAAYTNRGDITVSGGTVEAYTAEGDEFPTHALWSTSGDITITAGMVTAAGACAICNYEGNVTISGGTVRTTGDFGCTIDNSCGNVTVTGGTVEATGDSSYAMDIYDGNVTVYGGTVKATGNDSFVISLGRGGGVAAFLAGTCTGTMNCYGTVYGEIDCGLYVEVDTLAVTKDRDGTATGLTVKDGAGTAVWDCTGPRPVIKCMVDTATVPVQKTLEWWEYAGTHNPGPAATCTTAQRCFVCDELIKPALGHKAGPAATCTTAQTCTVCTAVLKAATGHKAGPAATCTTAQTCTVCQAVLKAATGHNPGPAATCTTAQTCTVCTAVLKAALGHKAGPAATCTTAQVCTVCALVFEEALGHTSSGWIVDTEPAAHIEGGRHKECTVCGDILETEVLPAKGIFGTNVKWFGAWWHYVLFFLGFGWIWMWF